MCVLPFLLLLRRFSFYPYLYILQAAVMFFAFLCPHPCPYRRCCCCYCCCYCCCCKCCYPNFYSQKKTHTSDHTYAPIKQINPTSGFPLLLLLLRFLPSSTTWARPKAKKRAVTPLPSAQPPLPPPLLSLLLYLNLEKKKTNYCFFVFSTRRRRRGSTRTRGRKGRKAT